MKNILLKTLINLRGNPRACVYTQPLWGLSMGLCIPYASVYMLALGLNDSQVGLVATICMFSQVGCALLGGPVTDKLGRRKTTAIFDFVAWCIPCLIWWRAGDGGFTTLGCPVFWFFFAAALLNGAMQIPANSWDCLLVEDADKDQITKIHSLMVAAMQFSVFFAPISAILFSRLTLVPAIRILYLNAFAVMSLKMTLLFIFSRETAIGKMRLQESRGKSIFSLVAGYGNVFKIIGKSRGTIFVMTVTALTGIVSMINNTFWQVIVHKRLLVPEMYLPFFPLFKSIAVIIFLFFIGPRLTRGILKLPLLTAFGCYCIGQTLLILAPVDGSAQYIILCISLIFDSFGSGYLFMLCKSLAAFHINPEERARVQAIMSLIVMSVTAPFGWIAGLLSGLSRTFPFVLSLCFLAAGFAITCIFYRRNPGAR